MDGDGCDSNNGDGVDYGFVSFNSGEDNNCIDGDNIVDCSDNKDGGGDGDSVDDGGVTIDGGSNPDFGNDKSKVDCSEDTTGRDVFSNDDGGFEYIDCCSHGADSDGDKNNGGREDKSDGDGNNDDGGSNDERGDNFDGDAKDGARDDGDNKDDIYLEGNDGEFLQINFVSISRAYDASLLIPDSIRCK